MNKLVKFDEDIWTVSTHSRFLIFHIGARMTIVRLPSGKLLLHSPVPIDSELKSEIDDLGEVAFIICPNNFHHMYALEATRLYPEAKLYGPRQLHKKRKDLKFDAELTEQAPPEWGKVIELISIEGSLLYETVFYHVPSKTLITCDVVENFASSDHAPTRFWLKIGGCHGHATWHRLLRTVYLNRRKARASFKRIFALPFERVIIAHGDNLVSDSDSNHAKEVLRQGLGWLV